MTANKRKGEFKKKFQNDSWYLIRFLDHAIGKGSVLTEICGFVDEESEAKDEVVFSYWRPIDTPEIVAANREPLTIIKSTIKRKKRIPSFEEDDLKRKGKKK